MHLIGGAGSLLDIHRCFAAQVAQLVHLSFHRKEHRDESDRTSFIWGPGIVRTL
ncbi:hypothetical protein RB3688 [Rhodopirellula baltica SH 1]|uniref:Uncharacterized protein n=1 Tax=Rhodopirellula baltica (strain DSM 10527 / NCIMB 13988 / SH1) TaxID=243090 RepID=Q7UTT7_RHOBA|nr:hypothetical protein RB3688 [Rhodopirellula baltica SH 1]